MRLSWVDPDFRPRHKPGCVHCARCGKQLKDGQRRRYIHVTEHWQAIHPEDDTLRSDDWFPVGMDCARKIGLEFTHATMPEHLARVTEGDLDPLFGHKIAAFDYLEAHAAELWRDMLEAPDNAARIARLCQVPGLGIVKSGFICQLMGYDVACLDSRNIKREGRDPEQYRSRKERSPAWWHKKIAAYLSEVEGRSAEYWDAWCSDVARVYDLTPHAVSELHMSIVPEGFVPF